MPISYSWYAVQDSLSLAVDDNRRRGAKNKVIAFGILERKGKESVDIVSDVSTKIVLQSTVKKVRRGSISYTDKWKNYSSLMFC